MVLMLLVVPMVLMEFLNKGERYNFQIKSIGYNNISPVPIEYW